MTGSPHFIRHGYMAEPDPVRWLRRIFGLLAIVFVLQAITAWQVHGIKSAVEQQEEEMPSMTVPVSVDPPGPQGVIIVPVTTTQGEFEADETEAAWIQRTKDTCTAVKAGLESA